MGQVLAATRSATSNRRSIDTVIQLVEKIDFTDLSVKSLPFKTLLKEGSRRMLQELHVSLHIRWEHAQARDSKARADSWAAFASASLQDKATSVYAFARGDLPAVCFFRTRRRSSCRNSSGQVYPSRLATTMMNKTTTDISHF